MESRESLINLSLMYKGDYRAIYSHISKREPMPDKPMPALKCKTLTILDPEYPDELRQMNMPPFVLYYYGDISLLKEYDKNIAVIGARDCTEYGITYTYKIVRGIAKQVNVVSGLARGIDAIAHEAAIRNGGRTIAILGCGIDMCYPAENKALYEEIKKNHLLISEYPGKEYTDLSGFPLRNRIIAQISKTVFITEAYEKSGTSITASYALEMNKDVACIPYEIGKNSFCNALIKKGAYLVESADDILEIMGLSDKPCLFPY